MSRNWRIQELVDLAPTLSDIQEEWDTENDELSTITIEVTPEAYRRIYEYAKDDQLRRKMLDPYSSETLEEYVERCRESTAEYPSADVATDEEVDEYLGEFCFEVEYRGTVYYDANICNRYEEGGRYYVELDLW